MLNKRRFGKVVLEFGSMLVRLTRRSDPRSVAPLSCCAIVLEVYLPKHDLVARHSHEIAKRVCLRAVHAE